MNHNKAPFPYAGGKSRAADLVWDLFGDPASYVEPFCGSMAVLLNRPHLANRTYFSETVNDADGLLVNAWRAIQLKPNETAEAASNPVAEADLHARHCALVKWRDERQLEHLMGDPTFCDPVMAGWWMWGLSCWIGGAFAHGSNGPWWPDETGRLTKHGKPGVTRQLPVLVSNGQGVNHANMREPGVWRNLPHLGDDGRGVNRPQMREPGVEFHDVTMPRLLEWFGYLSARLRHVRIVNGDWKRVTGPSVVATLPVRQGKHHAAVFLDPPYSAAAGRDSRMYAVDCEDVANEVRQWCIDNGDNPDYRIILCGFDTEHGELEDHGWTTHEWYTAGFLTGGYGNQNKNGHQQKRERMWASPACLAVRQEALW